MTQHRPTRRDFLQATGTTLGGAWLAMQLPALAAASVYARGAAAAGQAVETLSPDEARVLKAVASRFYPTDETPGANEAGVVYFMDRSLGTFWSWLLDPVRGGLAAMADKVAADHGGEGDFAALVVEDQDAALVWLGQEQPGTFFVLQLLVAGGMFGDPALGGNRDKVGWQLIGFEDRHVWEPPFGYYDREYRESGE